MCASCSLLIIYSDISFSVSALDSPLCLLPVSKWCTRLLSTLLRQLLDLNLLSCFLSLSEFRLFLHTRPMWPFFPHEWQAWSLYQQSSSVWFVFPHLLQLRCCLDEETCIALTLCELLSCCASRATVSAATAISTAFWKVSTASVRSLFCIASLFNPQTNLSRRASCKCVPKLQCSESCFDTATYCATVSPSYWLHLWKRNRSAIMRGLGK